MAIVGVIDLGVHRGISGLSVVALSDEDIARLVRPTGASEVVIRGAPVEAVRAVVPASMRVLSGDERRRELAIDAGKYVEGFHQILVAFGLVALAVSVFVIYNTFTILTARRTRELALWRCLGASRAQLRLLVLA